MALIHNQLIFDGVWSHGCHLLTNVSPLKKLMLLFCSWLAQGQRARVFHSFFLAYSTNGANCSFRALIKKSILFIFPCAICSKTSASGLYGLLISLKSGKRLWMSSAGLLLYLIGRLTWPFQLSLVLASEHNPSRTTTAAAKTSLAGVIGRPSYS